MKRYRLLKFTSLTAIFFFYLANTAAQEYFEGTVTYSINYTSLRNEIHIDNLKKIYGTRLTFSIKDGFTKKSYYNDARVLVQTRLFNPQNNLSIFFSNLNDTIYEYHPYKNDFNTEEFKHLRDTIIDGRKLEGLRVRVKSKTDPSGLPIIYTYYFNKELKVDPKHFERVYEGDWGKIVSLKKAVLYYYTVNYGGLYIARYKTEKIKHHALSEKDFTVPKNLFVKNIDDRSKL